MRQTEALEKFLKEWQSTQAIVGKTPVDLGQQFEQIQVDAPRILPGIRGQECRNQYLLLRSAITKSVALFRQRCIHVLAIAQPL